MSAADRIGSGVEKHLCAFKAPPPARATSSRSVRRGYELDRSAELCGVDLILECERAASRRNPRHRDPKRWSKTAWRRYLYIAAHAPSLVDLERIFGQ